MTDWINFFQSIASVATCISVVLLWRTTRANHERQKKEITIQYSDTHNLATKDLLNKIYAKSVYGVLDITKVLGEDNRDFLWAVEDYLFSMERFAVGVNSNVFDIYLFDRIMGQKTIEHFDMLKPYIEYIRKKDYEHKFDEFEYMVERLKKVRKERFPKKYNNKKGTIRNIF